MWQVELQVAVRRGLDGLDQVTSRPTVLQAAVFLGSNDNYLIATMHNDTLGPFTMHAAHQLTETFFGFL
nr:hypothetical protein [Chitinimonas arctica]